MKPLMFSGVKYLGSQLLQSVNRQDVPLPSYKVTRHDFRLDGEDLTRFKHNVDEGNAVSLFEAQVWSPYMGDTRGQSTTVSVSFRIGISDDDFEMNSRMVLNPDEAEAVNALITAAQNPPANEVIGSRTISLDSGPQRAYHQDRPQMSLELLSEVKNNLKEGLATNLFKQWVSLLKDNTGVLRMLAEQIRSAFPPRN